MSTPPIRLFPNRQTLVDMDAPPPPTEEITELDERVRRVAHLTRMSPSAPGFGRTHAGTFIDEYALKQECLTRHGHKGGQGRICDAMAPNKPLHQLLRDATSQELRRAGISRDTGVWVFRDAVGVKKQFGTTLWKRTGGKRAPGGKIGGKHMTLALTRCFVTGDVGDSSTISRHHYHRYLWDILCAPLRQDANNLISGLVASGGDFSKVPLHTRLDRTRKMCLEMDSIKANPSTTTYPSVKDTGGEKGCMTLRRALMSGDLAHLLTTDVPSDLRKKAGLKSRDKALMFTSSALQILPFVFPQTVFLRIERKKGGADVDYKKGVADVDYLKLVYGRCPITGVGGKKMDDDNWPVVLHHITVDGRHYLVGFILHMINTGLGALGDYKSN